MGPHETSVIDEEATVVAGQQPPAVGGSSPNATGRTRRLVVAVAVAAVAAVAAGAVVWSTAGGNPAPAGRADAATAPASESATPTLPAPVGAGTTADATSASAVPSARTAGPTVAQQPAAALLPAGWESRSFQGVTFAVPAGAQAPDVLDPGNADAPPTFVWTGPSLGDGVNAQISVWIYPAAQAPVLGAEYQPITVPGADQAHARTGVIGSEPALTAIDVHVLSGGRFINLVGMFAAGPAGEQMTRDLIASLSFG